MLLKVPEFSLCASLVITFMIWDATYSSPWLVETASLSANKGTLSRTSWIEMLCSIGKITLSLSSSRETSTSSSR